MKKVIKGLQYFFLILCLGYVIYTLTQEGASIRELFAEANPWYFLPGIMLWPLAVTTSSIFAWLVLTSRGLDISLRKILAIYLNRIPAKYLPGGIWQTFARAYDLNALGVSKTDISVLVFYENFWTVFIAALVSCSALLFQELAGDFQEMALLILIGLCGIPFLIGIFRKTGFVLSFTGYVKITFAGVLFWMIASTCFVLYLSAFDRVLETTGVFNIVVNYLFSYVAGFISIFTPQGVGVFEFVMTQLTDFRISATQAIFLLAGFRIVVLLGDMIAWLVFLIFGQYHWFQE